MIYGLASLKLKDNDLNQLTPKLNDIIINESPDLVDQVDKLMILNDTLNTEESITSPQSNNNQNHYHHSHNKNKNNY